MKKVKKFEDMKVVKSTDLSDSWSVDDILSDKKQFNGKKKLNLENGEKFEKILNDNRIFISNVSKGDWIKKSNLELPVEVSFIEYRVLLGVKQTFEEFLDYYHSADIDEYNELSVEEQDKLDNEFDELEIDDDHNAEFSVFLPSNVENIKHAALADGLEYLRLVSKSIPDMYERPTLDDPLLGDTEEVKKFINGKKLKITNNNLELAVVINYRLYKDSKFFDYFKDMCEKNNISYKDIINQLLSI